MLIEVKVPVLAESVSEATLVNWHKKAGEFVRVDENLVDLETDKVVLEVVAPKSGVIREIRKNDGANVLSDEVIAVIDTDGQASNDATPAAAQKPTAEIHQIAESKRAPAALSEIELKGMGPAVRKLITEYELDTSLITGSGKDGRITKSDVIKHIKTLGQRSQAENTPMPGVQAPAAVPTPAAPPPTALNLSDDRIEKRVPMSRLRARVAQRLKEAQNTAAILTTFNEVNMQPVMDLRNKYKDEFLARHEMKLGFMSFFAKACTEALRQHPIINASVDGNDIVYHGYYDIGVAVGSPRGLVVPILRDVDQMSFADIEKTINGYAKKAQDGKLSLDELTGGTFSISNGGVYGSMLSTPILNPPQSAILGMHSIQQRAVVENGNIVARPMMYLALSYDHRIVDGRDAVLFLITVKQALEDPARLLLDL